LESSSVVQGMVLWGSSSSALVMGVKERCSRMWFRRHGFGLFLITLYCYKEMWQDIKILVLILPCSEASLLWSKW
jgi:hypothetical protein